MNKLNYISPFLSFAAVVAAILGPIRLEKVPGWTGITPFGWAVVVIGVLSLILTLIRTHQQDRETQKERRKAEKAELALMNDTIKLLKPGIERIYRVLEFAFLLPHLGKPEDPRNVREDMKPARLFPDDSNKSQEVIKNAGPIREHLKPKYREKIGMLSNEWITSLSSFNYLPRRGFRKDIDRDRLKRRPDILDPEDPYQTKVPFATDKRQFQKIISEETTIAVGDLQTVLEKATFSAFHASILDDVKELMTHPVVLAFKGFDSSIKKYLRLEDDYEAKDLNHENYDDPEFWEKIKVSLVIDGGVPIGVTREQFREFATLFSKVRKVCSI